MYPRRNSEMGARAEPGEEEERKTRAAGLVSIRREERIHDLREE